MSARRPFVFLGALLLLGSCREDEAALSSGSVAAIDAEVVRFEEFVSFLKRSVGEEIAGLESGVLSALFDQFLEERLLLRLASDRGLVKPGAPEREALGALLAQAASAEVSDHDVANYYARSQEEFRLPERVELHQILVEEREVAERAVRELEEGVPFDEVARRLSLDPSAPYGGYQGELSREDLPIALGAVIFELGEGQRSEIVEEDYGFHIFYVARKLPAEVVPLQAAAAEIRQRLLTESADRSFRALVAEARQRYNVTIEPGNLPFDYRPSSHLQNGETEP